MAVFQPKLEAITTLLSTHRVSVANLLELCSKLNISPFIFGEEIISHSYARRIGVFGGRISPNRGQPFEALDENVEDDLKPIGLQDSPEMVTRHYFQLPPEIWAAIGSSVEPILYWRDVLSDEFLRGAENWLQWEGSKEFFQIHPAFEIHINSLSPLLLSREDLNIMEAPLRLLVQLSPSLPKSNLAPRQSIIKKPHSAYTNQLIREGCNDWREAWQNLLNLANGEWIEFGEYRCKLTKQVRTIGKESIKVEMDYDHKFTLKRNAFRTNFGRLLKKSAH